MSMAFLAYRIVHLMVSMCVGLIYVDASQKANMGSSCSHSCDANCTSSVVARDGKLVIVLTTVIDTSIIHSSIVTLLSYSRIISYILYYLSHAF